MYTCAICGVVVIVCVNDYIKICENVELVHVLLTPFHTKKRVYSNNRINPLYRVMPQISTAKHWRGTLNNYTENEVQSILSTLSTRKAKYFYIVAKEIGKEEKTPHLQMYISTIHLKGAQKGRFRPLPMLSVKRDGVECSRWFKCDNTTLSNYMYCKKDGDVLAYHMPEHVLTKAAELETERRGDMFGETDAFHKGNNRILYNFAKWWYDDDCKNSLGGNSDREMIEERVRCYHSLGSDPRIKRVPWDVASGQTFTDWARELFSN